MVFLELFYGGYFSNAPANLVTQLVLFVLVTMLYQIAEDEKPF